MLVLLLSLGACTDGDTGYSPVVTLDTPLDGESFRDDTPTTLSGTALDGDSAEDALVARFLIGDDVLCDDVAVDGDGLLSCQALIPQGEHTLTLSVVDPDGNSGSDAVSVVGLHDNPPEITITAPQAGDRAYAEAAVVLSGRVVDDFDAPSALSTWWESDLDGGLGLTGAPEDDGTVATTVTLGQGEHVLTLYAQDTLGGLGSASVALSVGPTNAGPGCGITAPDDGVQSDPGAELTFLASADDDQQDPESLEVAWESDLDGLLGTDGPASDGQIVLSTTSLSQGIHDIQLTVTDDGGLACTDTISVTVGLPPQLTLLDPIDGGLAHDVDGVTLYALAIDDDGPNTDVVVVWTSDVDGVVHTGAALSDGSLSPTVKGLTPGAQTLTAVATDGDGLSDTESVSFTLNQGPTTPVVSISPDPAYTVDDLVAVVSTESVDPEGSDVTYGWAWTVDGGTDVYSTTDTLPHALTAKGQAWQVALTPNDGLVDGATVTARLTVSNSPPVGDGALLTPNPGYRDATLLCDAYGVTDADGGDVVSLSYDWIVSGTALAVPDPELTPDYFGLGDVVECQVIPSDGYQDGATLVSNEVTIENQLPEVASVAISPASAYVDDTLTCAYSGYSDADGDPDGSTYAWTVDGTEVGTGTELSGAFVRDQEVVCTVTPNDGIDDGLPVTASLTVLNSLPALGGAVITPDPAQVGDTLRCDSVDYADLDGDADASTVIWYVDTTQIGTGDTIATDFDGGDRVRCLRTAHDGTDSGNTVEASLTITNSAPSIVSVSITPDPAAVDDTLSCAWSGFVDPDGDADSSHLVWAVNGVDVSSSVTLPGGFVGGDTVTCTVTPDDGEDEGTPVVGSLVIDNSAPSITGVSIVPDPAVAGDTLTCRYSGFSDPDGDSDLSSFAWFINGSSAGTGSSLGGSFVGGDVVGCEVTPDDGSDPGTPVLEAIVIDNSPPVLAEVTISPDPAATDDSLTCTAGATTDPDGTTAFTHAYEWRVNGGVVGSGDTLDSAEHGRDDQVVCSVIPSDGTDDGDAVDSAVLVIDNTAPVVLSVSLDLTDPATQDTLGVVVSTSDLDDDSVSLIYAWAVDGSDIGVSSSTLSGVDWFDRGQTVSVTVTPDDGTDTGAAATSASVTVVNTAPGEPTVDIQPSGAYGGIDDLVCLIDNDADDLDGDSLTYTMTWSVDGLSYTGATTDVWSGDTVPAADTFGGESWACEALPSDGDLDGTVGVASVLLGTCASVDFDGSSSYGTVSDATDLRLTGGNYTVEAWFRLDSLGSDDAHLLSKRDGTSGWDGWMLGVSGTASALGSGKLFFALGDADVVASSTSVTEGAWTHVAFVNDPSLAQVRLYVDGVEEDSASLPASGSTTTDLVLGRDSAASARWFDGQLSEVRLSQGVRYSADFSPDDEFEDTPQSYLAFRFDESAGSSVEDISGNGHDATLSSAGWVASCNYE